MPAARHFQSLDTALCPPLYKLVAILNHRKENLFFHKYLSTILHHCRLWLSLMCNWDIISWTMDKTVHDSAICHNIFSRAVWWKYRFLPRSQLWSEWRGGEWGEFYRAVPAAAECAQAHRALAPDTPAKLGWRWRTDIHIAHMDTFLHPAAARSTHNAQFAGIHTTRIPSWTREVISFIY